MADDTPEPPDPTEVVHLLKSDFELLQTALNVATQDFGELFDLLGIPPEPPIDAGGRAPREILFMEAFPRIVTLINAFCATRKAEDEVTKKMRAAAARYGNKAETFVGGVQGLKVGQKDPQLAARMALADGARDVQREMKRRAERRGNR